MVCGNVAVNKRGGSRPVSRNNDKRLTATPPPPGPGRAPDIVAAAEKVAQQLINHAHRFSDADLNRIGNALRSGTGSVESEFTRRQDKEAIQ